ncbi:MAG TPA: glycosyltransferase, partial [Phycisphaerae bacterium]|nr:glycosyltransferase [Phycisphaerae bacterium]
MSATIGVVIPGHNFRRNLEWTLAALAPQIEAGDEVIAVDDHSTEPLPDRMAKATPWLRIVHREASGGPGNRSAARNAGWRASRGEIIAFLDADMVPSPGFLHALRGLHARHPRIVVKAPRHSLPPRKQRLGKTHCLDLIASADRWAPGPGAPNGDGAGECRQTGKWYLAASNALSVRRRHVVRIGGWDEGFHGWGEEDMDFAYRLHRIGLSFVFPPSRLLYAVHLDHPVAADQAESLRRNALRFVSKFPEVYPVRLPAYNACGISLAARGAKGPDGDPFRGDSAGEGGEARQSPASLPYALPYAESQESGPPHWGPPPLDYVYHEPPDWDPAALDYVYHEPPERPGWGEWQTEMTQRMGGVFDAGEGAAARVSGDVETFEEHRRKLAARLSLVPLVWIVVSVLIGVLVSGSWLRRAITGCVLAS